MPWPIDIVYLFRHSRAEDLELRLSLRSVARHLPFIRKVWVFGDRPAFLSEDKDLIEHVPHRYMAPLLGYRVPVRSDFLMLALASLIPGVEFHFVRFSDDYIVLQPLTCEQLLAVRALEDLNAATDRGEGKWKQSLWRTYDILKRYGYAGINFEAHVPHAFTKRLVFEAFMAFRPFLSEERHAGMLSATTIYNYTLQHYGLKFSWLRDERARAGFYGKCPEEAAIEEQCRDKLFLNFDDAGFGPPMSAYLSRLFDEPCKYESYCSV
jgi:hypothetical protein